MISSRKLCLYIFADVADVLAIPLQMQQASRQTLHAGNAQTVLARLN